VQQLDDYDLNMGFVRHFRTSFKHEACGSVTGLSRLIAEGLASDPGRFETGFCGGCLDEFPIGPDGEFVWPDDGSKVGA